MTALDCARSFVTKPDRDAGGDITHLESQKRCCYAQAWRLALFGARLFEATFEAWPRGPVCRAIREAHKGRGCDPLPADPEFDPQALTSGEQSFLDGVWSAYGKFTAKHLEELAHQERPWIGARGGLPPGARCNVASSDDSVRAHYAAVVEP